MDKYVPDPKEPHLHIHKGGITFADSKHHHNDLVVGEMVRVNAIETMFIKLQDEDATRAAAIIEYMNKEYPDETEEAYAQYQELLEKG